MSPTNMHVGGMGLAGQVHRRSISSPNHAQSGSKQPKDPSLFGEHPPSRGGSKRGGFKRSSAKRAKEALPTKRTNMGSYFANIDLDVEELMIEGPPMKKKKAWPEKRIAYKYPRSENFLPTHSVEEIKELLVAGLEFSDLRMVKLEAEQFVPGLSNLVPRLNDRCPINWNIPTSFEQYIEEIELANYIQATLVDPTVEVELVPISGAIVPSVA